MYKKNRISNAPVRRYQNMVEQDYKKHKVIVCAHLQNVFNSFCLKRGKTNYGANYFDIEKWINKMTPGLQSGSSPTKDIKRLSTIAIANNVDE